MRNLNRVEIIGNVTRDPELRYTASGTAIATFSVATNRSYKTESGEAKEEVEFHRVVVWSKLAEICSQYLSKGAPVYLDGRLQTRKWTDEKGTERQTTEITANDVILLANKQTRGGENV